MIFKVRVESVEMTRSGYSVGLRESGKPFGHWIRVTMPEPLPFQQEFMVSISPVGEGA